MLTADPVDLIVEGAEKLAAEDRCGWSSAALGDRMTSIAAARELLDAEMLRVTGQWDAAGGWGADGYLSPRSWLTDNTPVNSPAASRQVRNARHVQQFDATADALADGLITTAKVELLAEVAKGREELYVRDEHVLLEAAKRLSLRDLTTALRTWRHLADDEIGTDDPGKGFERIGLHVSPTPLGSVLSGFLDPEGATTLTNALDLLEPPDSQHGPDARRAVPTVELVFTVDSLRGIGALALDDHRCDLAGFGSVPLDTIHRLACEARVGWIVFDGKRVPFDWGRWRRNPSMAQRRAVVMRDRHCQYPGCDAPARWCDVHHLVPWEEGGPTDLHNLVLLCRRHHVMVHEGGKRLVRELDGTFRVERRPRGVRRMPRNRAGPSG